MFNDTKAQTGDSVESSRHRLHFFALRKFSSIFSSLNKII